MSGERPEILIPQAVVAMRARLPVELRDALIRGVSVREAVHGHAPVAHGPRGAVRPRRGVHRHRTSGGGGRRRGVLAASRRADQQGAALVETILSPHGA